MPPSSSSSVLVLDGDQELLVGVDLVLARGERGQPERRQLGCFAAGVAYLPGDPGHPHLPDHPAVAVLKGVDKHKAECDGCSGHDRIEAALFIAVCVIDESANETRNIFRP